MKKVILLAFIVLGSIIPLFGQDCVNEVFIEDLSLKFCLNEKLSVHQLNDTEVSIVGYDQNGRDEWVIKLRAAYNSEDQSEKELWQKIFGDRTHTQNVPFHEEDSSFVNQNWKGYMNYGVMNLGSNTVASASAIILYHHQYYSLLEISFEDTLVVKEHMKLVLNSISFQGEPKLKDDKLIKQDFEQRLLEAINDSDKAEELTISIDKMIQVMGEDAHESFYRDTAELRTMFDRWRIRNKEVLASLQQCDSVKIGEIFYNLDEVDGPTKGYSGRMFIECGEEVRLYRFGVMSLEDKMYLAILKESQGK